jgi:hypothetical protein
MRQIEVNAGKRREWTDEVTEEFQENTAMPSFYGSETVLFDLPGSLG